MSDETHTVTLAEVVAAARLTRRVEEILREHDLSVSILAMLATIDAHPDTSITATMRTLGVSPRGVTLSIDKLERRGLVTRAARHATTGAGDGRTVTVALTARGRAVLAEFATMEIGR